jgi:hypothetical protein
MSVDDRQDYRSSPAGLAGTTEVPTVPANALDDASLYRETASAFRKMRSDLADGDTPSYERLVELQHEFLRRFPGIDIPVD